MPPTMFLLGLLYVVFISGVLVAVGAGAGIIVIVALVMLGGQLFASDKLALAAMGAKQVTPQEAPELHAMIERLCVQANLPKPKIAIAQTTMPNAFAIGRSPKSATVCATTGIMQILSPVELEGVMAHELTHVQNRDVMVMTIASFFATIAATSSSSACSSSADGANEEEGDIFIVVSRLDRRLPDLVHPAAGALALPRVRCRPRRRRDHRPPERVSLRAAEDQRHDGAGPQRDLRTAESMRPSSSCRHEPSSR